MLLNKSRAHGLMADHGIDAMVAAMPENVTYLSDYSYWQHWFRRGTTTAKGGQRYAVLPRDEDTEPALVTDRLSTYLAQWPSWIESLYTYVSPPGVPDGLDPEVAEDPAVQRLQRYVREARRCDSPADALITALQERGLERGVIALDVEGVSIKVLGQLTAALPDATFLDGGEFFRYVRAVKTPEEVERLRASATVNEHAILRLLDAVEPGRTERELADIHRIAVTEQGGTHGFINVHAGKRCGQLWEPTDRPIRPGELVWADGGCTVGFYHSDTGLCAVAGGEPSAPMVERFQMLEAGMHEALSALKPGRRCSEVTDRLNDALEQNGAPRRFGFGHAVGIEPRDIPFLQAPYRDFDDPILRGSTDLVLEEGMVINLEVPYWEWNIGALQIEYTLVLTEGGNEPLIPQGRRLFIR